MTRQLGDNRLKIPPLSETSALEASQIADRETKTESICRCADLVAAAEFRPAAPVSILPAFSVSTVFALCLLT